MTTDSRTLYATLLGLKAPWEIEDVAMDRELGEVRVRVALPEMNMCVPCIQSTLLNVPAADEKIVFDTFHIAQLLNKAVDQVRRREHSRLSAKGDPTLKGTKCDWLRHPGELDLAAAREFAALSARVHRVARAWELKETAMAIFDLEAAWATRRDFADWYRWAIRSQLEPIKRAARTLKKYWDQIENYFRHRITNARAEGINGQIQRMKTCACGFRSRERFRMAIYFHCGGLDLYPSSLTCSQ